MTNDPYASMRYLAFMYQFRKYTNTGDFTEEEIQRYISLMEYQRQVNDPERCRILQNGLQGRY